MATYAGKLNVGGTELPIGSTLYGTCDTEAATAAKVVTMANFDKLLTGVTIHVKFTYANGVANPTLNVNSTGAKNIYRYGTTAPSTSAASSWQAGSIVSFTYDGSYWQMNDWLNDNTNNAVTQTATTTSSDYEVLFSATADNTTRTEGARKNSNLKFNPSTGNLQVTKINGVDVGSSPKFTDNNTTYGLSISDHTVSLVAGGSTSSVTVPDNNTTYSAGTGLSLSGTKFNHSNSVTAGTVGTSSATNGQSIAVPYVTYDAQGHITAAGTHTHTTTVPPSGVARGNDSSVGGLDPVTAAYIPNAASNKSFGLPAAAITIEYSTNGGSTWTDYGATDAQKVSLFNESRAVGYYLGKATAKANNTVNNQLRVTIEPTDRYCSFHGIYVWFSTQGNTCVMDLERSTIGAKNTFSTVFTGQALAGWSGNNIRYFNYGPFGGGSTQTGNTYKYRITFRQTAVNTNYPSSIVNDIRFLGDNLWSTPSDAYVKNMLNRGVPYSTDATGNVTFPKGVVVSGSGTDGFTYSGIESASANADRCVWFADSSAVGRPVYDNDFKYNPSSNNLTVGKVNGYTIAASVPSGAKFTDTTYTAQTTSIGSASAGTAIPADDITAWTANTPASASVDNGVLTITNGTAASLSYTAKSIPNISVTSKTVATGITAS